MRQVYLKANLRIIANRSKLKYIGKRIPCPNDIALNLAKAILTYIYFPLAEANGND
jgi:hypothetical protein